MKSKSTLLYENIMKSLITDRHLLEKIKREIHLFKKTVCMFNQIYDQLTYSEGQIFAHTWSEY